VTIGVGVIGLGHVGQFCHLYNFLHYRDSQVLAVCDSRKELAKTVALKHSIPKFTDNADDLLTDPAIQAVVVAVDRGSTFLMSKLTLMAGKHLLTEKPMALNLHDANYLVSLARRKGLVYKVGFMRKFDIGIDYFVNQVKVYITNDELGKLNHIRIHCLDSISSYAGGYDTTALNVEKHPAPQESQIPNFIPKSRGLDYLNTLNVYSHHLNILNALLPSDTAYSVESVNLKTRAMRLAHLLAKSQSLQFEVTVLLEMGHMSAIKHDEYVEAYFDRGSIRVDFPPNMLRDSSAVVTQNNYGLVQQEISKKFFPYSWSFRNQALDFVRDVKNINLECINSGESCLKDMILHEKIWESELTRGQDFD